MIYKINYRKWYIVSSIISGLISMVYFIISRNNEIDFGLIGLLSINIAFHMMYLFTGYLTRLQMVMVGKHNPSYKRSLKMMKVFGYLFISIGIGILAYIVSLILIPNEFQREAFVTICIPFAILLGGINLLQNIMKRESEI